MANLLFDGNTVELDFTEGKNKSNNVPDWFVAWLIEKRNELQSRFFSKNESLQLKYPDNVAYPDPDNPGTIYKPASRSISYRGKVTISEEDGGDGIEHEIIYFERIIHDENAKDSIGGKRYTGANGHTGYVFKGQLFLNYDKVIFAIFLMFISKQKDRDFTVDDKLEIAVRKSKLRKLYNDCMSLLYDDNKRLTVVQIRLISSGLFKVSNAENVEDEVLRDNIADKLEAAWKSGTSNAQRVLEEFADSINMEELMQKKSFIQKCIDKKAVVIKRTDNGSSIHYNKGTSSRFEFGVRFCILREGKSIQDTLYEHLYNRSNTADVEMLKGFFGGVMLGGNIDKEQLQKMQDEYFNEFQVDVPKDKINDLYWIEKEVRRRVIDRKKDEAVANSKSEEEAEKAKEEVVLSSIEEEFESYDIKEMREEYKKEHPDGKYPYPTIIKNKDAMIEKIAEFRANKDES